MPLSKSTIRTIKRQMDDVKSQITQSCGDLAVGQHICCGDFDDPVLTVGQAAELRKALLKAVNETIEGFAK